MKKNILIASVVALAMGAQGQIVKDNPTEYNNPFEKAGLFNYIQKQSDGEMGKWFLSGTNGKEKYPSIENSYRKFKKNDYYSYGSKAAKVVVNKEYTNADDIQLCIVLDIRDKFNKQGDKYIDLSFDLIQDLDDCKYSMSVVSESYYNDNLVRDHQSNNNRNRDFYGENLKSSDWHHIIKIKGDKQVCIQFDLGKYVGTYFLKNFKIVGYTVYNNKQTDCFEEKYFNTNINISRISFDTRGGSEIKDMYCLNNGNGRYIIYDNDFNEIGECVWNNDNESYDDVVWKYGKNPVPYRDGYKFMGWKLSWSYNDEYYSKGESLDGIDFDFKKTQNNVEIDYFLYYDFQLIADWMEISEYNRMIEERATDVNDDAQSKIYVSNNVLYADEPSNVCIYNTCGVIVKKEHNVTTLDLSDLKKGVYVAKVNEKTIKFVR